MSQVIPHKTLIYALGGGLGHVTRGLALARKLLPLIGGQAVLLTNSPFAAAVKAEVARCEGLSLRTISSEAQKPEVAALVRNYFEETQPALVFVDTFPRGIGGELAEIFPALASDVKKMLIARNLPRDYVESFGLFPFAEHQYGLVLIPGETSVWEEFPGSVRVPPILIRDREEILSPVAAADFLRLSPGEKCILFVGSGTLAELKSQGEMIARLAENWPADRPPLRWAGVDFPNGTPGEWIVSHYPAGELFSAVHALVGSAGYNLVHEAELAQVPLFCLPQPRTYDDQFARAKSSAVVVPITNTDDLRAALVASPSLPCNVTHFENGAAQAAALIASLCDLTGLASGTRAKPASTPPAPADQPQSTGAPAAPPTLLDPPIR